MTKLISYITLKQPRIIDFSEARQDLLRPTATPWAFFLDSDETITEELRREINQAAKHKEYNYAVKRTDWFLGRKLNYGESGHNRFVRLVQPKTGSWQGQVHEKFISSLPVKTLVHPLLHRQNISIRRFIHRLNYYSSLRAVELAGDSLNLLKLIFFPGFKFIYNYFFRLGFKDGFPGLALAFLMSLHSLMVRVKVYEKTAAI